MPAARTLVGLLLRLSRSVLVRNEPQVGSPRSKAVTALLTLPFGAPVLRVCRGSAVACRGAKKDIVVLACWP